MFKNFGINPSKSGSKTESVQKTDPIKFSDKIYILMFNGKIIKLLALEFEHYHYVYERQICQRDFI